MNFTLANDNSNHPAQIGNVNTDATAQISVAAASARVALPVASIVRVASSTDCYIKWGTVAVNAAITLVSLEN